MDTTLATVTVISLGLAWAMAIVTWQRVRAERRRSEDRVADLMAELAGAPPSGAGSRGRTARRRGAATRSAAAVARGGEVDGDLDVLDVAGAAAFVRESDTESLDAGLREPAARVDASSPRRRRAPIARRLPFAAAAPGRTGAPRGGVGRGAAPIPSAPTHWRRASAAVVVATILVACVYFAERTPLLPARAERAPLSRIGAYLAERAPLSGIGAYLAERTPLPRAGADAPVELLSLHHLRQGDYLAVSGSLRNPPEGRERSKLSIAATVFDRSGAVIGAGQTPLPPAVLAPGEETVFTISLPSADRIERYRVSFMEDESRLAHIDRRRPEAGAQAGP